MKKIIGYAAAVVIAVIFAYMVFQEFSAPKPLAESPAAIPAAAPQAAPQQQEIDEQALALEEMKRSAGKLGLSKLYIVKCSSCHGRDGSGPIGASIAGKSVEYNMTALMKYKNGQVPNTLMKGLLENTSEAELKTLADEISAFK